MQFAELTGKTTAQLKDMLMQLRKEQMNLRFQKAANQLPNANRWREVRQTIARIKTAMTQSARKESK